MLQIRGEDAAEFLEEDQAEIFHHSLSQLLFISSKLSRYIQTVVLFLNTIFKQLDGDY